MTNPREPHDRLRLAQLVVSGARLVVELLRWWR